jgi:hypothetical protein
MSAARARFAWAPALLVGAAAAISAEVAIGILLYASPGFMRSLTTLLAVEGVALAAGLHTAPIDGPGQADRLRLRWLFCLGVFLVAAVFGTMWSLIETLGQGPLGQGLGLALLAGLPLFACGTLLGGMSSMAHNGVPPRTGAAAALGAALGFVATGALLPRAPIPATLLVGCLMLLSGGGMIYGSIVGDRPLARGAIDADMAPASERASIDAHGVSGSGDVAAPDASVGDPPQVILIETTSPREP